MKFTQKVITRAEEYAQYYGYEGAADVLGRTREIVPYLPQVYQVGKKLYTIGKKCYGLYNGFVHQQPEPYTLPTNYPAAEEKVSSQQNTSTPRQQPRNQPASS